MLHENRLDRRPARPYLHLSYIAELFSHIGAKTIISGVLLIGEFKEGVVFSKRAFHTTLITTSSTRAHNLMAPALPRLSTLLLVSLSHEHRRQLEHRQSA